MLRILLRWLLLTTKYTFIIIALLSIAVTAFLYLAPTFGRSPDGNSLTRIKSSPHYSDGRFQNLTLTQLDTKDPSQSMDIKTYFMPPEGKNPDTPLPSLKFDASNLTAGQFVWFGHSTVLFNTGGSMILADPVFNRASPVPAIGNPFPLQNVPTIAQLPDIDIVIISHDHYDHLDHLAIAALEPTTKQFLVPLGVGAHLQRWGIPVAKIIEFDWYQSETINDIAFTLTPARHFSGRGISNRFSTLWGSWVVHSDESRVFFSGDSGYFKEFKKIGDRFGPFDIAFIENGAYSQDWAQVHMFPEQSAQAALDLGAKIFFPIHWSKFDLAQHPWVEPINRATAAAQLLGLRTATPVIGQIFDLQDVPQTRWWE